jgi:LysM repeat protein
MFARALLGVVLLGCLFGWVTPAEAQPSQALEMVTLVNQYRAERGLGALAIHPALMAAAQSHVDWMVATGNYGHTGEGGSSPADRAKAAGYPTAGWYVYENWTGGATPQQALAWWDASPIHHQTLNLQGFEHIGVGYSAGGRRGIYVLIVAKPSLPVGSDAADAAPPDDGPTPFYVEPIVQAAPGPDGTIIHVVGEGQTAWDIAVVYDVDLDEMLALNALRRPVVLRPGDQIIVKLGPNAIPPTREPLTHIVREGDTAWAVAAIYGLTLDELLALNGIDRSTVLHPGDLLLIRAPEPTAETSAPPAETTTLPTFTPVPLTITASPIPVAFAPTWTHTPTETEIPLTITPSPVPVTFVPTWIYTSTVRAVAALPTATFTLMATSTPAPVRADTREDRGVGRAALVGVGVAAAGLAVLFGGAALALRRR